MKIQLSILRRLTGFGAIAIIAMVSLVPSCSTPPTCNVNPDRSPSGECWFGDCRLENGKLPYPNPVSKGGTVKLDMTCGVASRNMQFQSTSVQVTVCNSLGQVVSSFTAGPFPPNSSIQQIPIWSNVNVAAGTYLITVVTDLGLCGTKTPIKNFKIVVI